MTPAEVWLRERLPRAPERLMAEMARALPAAPLPVADALAEGALSLYSAVLAGSGAREDAWALLAADALLTHSFQAQAELDPARLADLAERLGGRGRLGELSA